MEYGTDVRDQNFNVFCYADDLLITSKTITGLQKLLNFANMYMKSHGLRFNPITFECLPIWITLRMAEQDGKAVDRQATG